MKSISVTGKYGFTLMELLVVIAIIGILVGMISSAAYSARQNSYRAAAQAETQNIANAVRSYWTAFGAWPKSLAGANANLDAIKSDAGVKLGKANLKELIGDNNYDISFLEVDEEKSFGESNDGTANMFLDPWGNPYRLIIQQSGGSPERRHTSYFTTAVSFPMRDATQK